MTAGAGVARASTVDRSLTASYLWAALFKILETSTDQASLVTVHILRMAVGVTDVDHLRQIQANRQSTIDGRTVALGFTRRKPRRVDEVVGGGSMYWIVKGFIQVRQRILGLADAVDGDGEAYCQIHYDPELVPTVAVPRRPMQGWRYLDPADAPADLGAVSEGDDALPPEMAQELRSLGLL